MRFTEQPLIRALPEVPLQIDVPKTMRNTAAKVLDAFVDSFFEFIDKPLLPSQVPSYIYNEELSHFLLD